MRNSRVMNKLRAGEPVRIAMLGHVLPPFLAYAATVATIVSGSTWSTTR